MNSTYEAVNLKQVFNLLMRMLASITTVAIASGALFSIGFYVIPVFADKAPQIFAEETVNNQILPSQQNTMLEHLNQADPAKKKQHAKN